MERRKALKDLGLGTFSIFAGSLLFSSLQSCSSGPSLNWQPKFFTNEEATQMERICEAIMPKTDTPGATEAGVVPHLDISVHTMDSQTEKAYLKQGLQAFLGRFESNMGVSFDKATSLQVGQAINGYLRGMSKNPNLLKNYQTDLRKENEKSQGFFEIHFVYTVVNATIWSYLTSELIGEQIMLYDPIPGDYDGCVKHTNGTMAWSYL